MGIVDARGLSIVVPRPAQIDVVSHSPTPSMVRTAASSYGDGRKADAAWERWCVDERTSHVSPGHVAAKVSATCETVSRFHPCHSGITVTKAS